jgi:hypothetical protein
MMNDLFSGLFNFSNNDTLLKLVLAVIVISFITSMVRSLFRLMLPVIVLALVMVVFLGYAPEDLLNKGKQLTSFGTSFLQENIMPFLDKEFPMNEEEKEKKYDYSRKML